VNPIGITYGDTWEVLRGARDRVGDQVLTVHHVIEQAAFWEESVDGDDERRTASTVYGKLAIPKAEEVQATDRLRRQGDSQIWIPIGSPQWDQIHPMTGWDPGYKIVRLKGVGA
jgi:hypothetical protein